MHKYGQICCQLHQSKCFIKWLACLFTQSASDTFSLFYNSGAQCPARRPYPARDESSCGPWCPTRKATSYTS